MKITIGKLRNNSASQILALALLAGSIAHAHAEVITDGSVGAALPLTGPDFAITPDLGQQRGANLFHSFSNFNISSTESATFSGTGISNIISRVTGVSGSSIDGVLNSSASLWLINPNGVVFGQSASLNITGSLHVSTADSLGDGNGGLFYANPATDPTNALLFVNDPTSFGFLNGPSGVINLNSANLSVSPGQTISLVGSQVLLDSSSLTAEAGRLNLVSVGNSVGTVTLDGGITYSGSGEQVSMSNNSELNTDGPGGGSIFIRGGQFLMGDNNGDTATISANTTGAVDGGGIDIQVANSISVHGNITSKTDGIGNAGDIAINTPVLNLDGEIRTSTTGAGDAGTISFDNTTDMAISGTGKITATTASTGKAGSIEFNGPGNVIVDGVIDLIGQLDVAADTSIESTTNGGGTAGTITINTPVLNLDGEISAVDGGTISFDNTTDTTIRGTGTGKITATTASTGKASSIEFNGPGNVIVDGVTVSTVSRGIGMGGSISIAGNNFELKNGAKLLASTEGSRDAGNIDIDLVGQLDVAAGTSIESTTNGAGAAGTIDISNAATANIDGKISTSSTAGVGDASDISLVGIGQLKVNDGGTIKSTSTGGDGAAGNILISDSSAVIIEGEIVSDSSVVIINGDIDSTKSGSGNAGAITFENIEDLTIFGVVLSKSGTAGNAGVISISQVSNLEIIGGTLSAASTDSKTVIREEETVFVWDSIKPIVSLGFITKVEKGLRRIRRRIVIFPDFTPFTTEITTTTPVTGDAGSIKINETNSIFIANSSFKTNLEAPKTGPKNHDFGGDIEIAAKNVMFVADSTFEAVAELAGNGGNINLGINSPGINPIFLILERNIINANATGDGGDIYIYGQNLLGGENKITATGKNGNDGEIIFDAQTEDLVDVVTLLDIPFLNVASILNKRCAVNVIKDRSSFVIEAAGLPPAPDRYAPSNFNLRASANLPQQAMGWTNESQLAINLPIDTNECHL